MKNWMLVAFTLLLITGCAKYTTPRKVEKRISEGTWKITAFTSGGNTIAGQYATYTFNFNEGGNVTVKNSGSAIAYGSWEVGLGKNPAILYLSFPPVGGLEYLADDWQVIEMKKDLMRLKRNDSSGDNSSVTFQQ
jgi:hypothetical protein